MVPMRVAHEKMDFQIALCVFPCQGNAEFTNTRAAIEDHDVISAADFHAGGISSIANRFRTRRSDRPAGTPELHAEDRASNFDRAPDGIQELLTLIRLYDVFVG